jgi:hypothetical protein
VHRPNGTPGASYRSATRWERDLASLMGFVEVVDNRAEMPGELVATAQRADSSQ